MERQDGRDPMQTPIKTLEELFYQKIMLYQELADCLDQEREFLVKTDMDALWEISDKKQAIVTHIESVRGKILSTLSEASIDHGMNAGSFSLAKVLSLIPSEARAPFRKANLSLANLKAETRQRSQENKLFVEQSLDFLDELIGILTNTGKKNEVYSKGQVLPNKAQGNLLLHREV
jgi:flagellar biosynthesis/type III secretory pathway chaperone